MKNKFIKALLILVSLFLFLPSSVKAVKVTATKYDPFGNKTYYTKGWNKNLVSNIYKYTAQSYRITSNLEKFTVSEGKNEGNRVFCIEPGAKFSSSTTYTIKTPSELLKDTKKDYPDLYNSNWKVNKTELEKLMSCVKKGESDNNVIIAAQAITWELVTKERSKIDASKILKSSPDYAPYTSDGTRYLANDSKNSLYEVLKSNSSVYSAYKNLLTCAARFDSKTTPSWGNKTKALGLKSAATATSKAIFEASFPLDSNVYAQKDLLKYYKCSIGSKEFDCKGKNTVDGITLDCTYNSCKVTTDTIINKNSSKKITFKYSKNNSLKDLSETETAYYIHKNKDGVSDVQTLMQGSTSKSFTLNVYTGDAPTYKIRIEKVDKNNKRITTGTPKFIVYEDSAHKKVACKEFELKSGIGECEVSRTGTFYVVETVAPSGYVKKSGHTEVNVKSDDTVSNTKVSYNKIQNTEKILKMIKYTIDPETGQKVDLTGDSCTVPKCSDDTENGPIFTINQGNKFVCVKETTEKDTYLYDSTSESCTGDTTNKIKTCNGKFNIKNIPTGTYVVKEIKTVCGAKLPENPTKEVVIAENTELQEISMENKSSGVIFSKYNETGSFLAGGKFALQKKENNIYKDIPLKHKSGAIYVYDKSLLSSSENILLKTEDGVINVTGLPVGEYRFVEKEAPNGYNPIKDKDSTALFTISDASSDESIQVSLVNRKVKEEGSYDEAELIVTIITGRKVINFGLVIGALAVLLGILIYIRKKFRK